MNELVKRLSEHEQEIAGQIELIENHELENDADLVQAHDMLKQVKGKVKLLEEERKLTVQPMNEQVKEINAWFKPAVTKLEKMETILKRMIGAYTVKQAALQRQLLLEAAEAQRKALEERSVTDCGPLVPEEALEKMEAAQAAAPLRLAGLSVNLVWKWELIDESQVPVEYKSVDSRKVDAAMKAGKHSIPGIRFYEEPAVRSGSK